MPTSGSSIRSAVPASPFSIGETVAQRYRVETLLSEDALGFTYTVSELATAGEADGSLRVLRVLRARLGAQGVKLPDEALSTWRSQLEKAQELRHANIPAIDEMCFGDEHGRVFVIRHAIELEGQPLSALLAARPAGLSEAEAVRLLAGIAEVVEAAHQHGLLHLSLSPNRIFVVPSGESVAVRVADFALLPPALAAQDGEAGYLTPEQVEGQPCDRRSDQFVLAVILYEMLSSQPAFIGAADEDRQVTLSRVQHEDPLPLALSRPLEQALARALSRSKAVRFPNLHDFVRALGIDGVAWSLVFPPGSTKSPPILPVRQSLWLPVLLGAAVASLVIFAIWGLRSRAGSDSSSHGPLQGESPRDRVGGSPPLQPEHPVDAAADAASPDVVVMAADMPTADPGTSPAGAALQDAGSMLPPERDPSKRIAGTSRSDLGTGPGRPPGILPGGSPPPGIPPVSPPRPPNVPGTPSGTGFELDISLLDGKPLASSIKAPILYCIRLIRPSTPFRLILQDIGGTLYVANQSPPNELKQSSDFRNCLRTEFHGKIEPKELSLKGFLRPKSSQ